MLQFFKIPVANVTLTSAILSAVVTQIWDEVYKPLHTVNSNMHIMLMCKVEFNNPQLGYKTVGHLRKVNYSDKELYLEYLTGILGILSEAYIDQSISRVVFSYIVIWFTYPNIRF